MQTYICAAGRSHRRFGRLSCSDGCARISLQGVTSPSQGCSTSLHGEPVCPHPAPSHQLLESISRPYGVCAVRRTIGWLGHPCCIAAAFSRVRCACAPAAYGTGTHARTVIAHLFRTTSAGWRRTFLTMRRSAPIHRVSKRWCTTALPRRCPRCSSCPFSATTICPALYSIPAAPDGPSLHCSTSREFGLSFIVPFLLRRRKPFVCSAIFYVSHPLPPLAARNSRCSAPVSTSAAESCKGHW